MLCVLELFLPAASFVPAPQGRAYLLRSPDVDEARPPVARDERATTSPKGAGKAPVGSAGLGPRLLPEEHERGRAKTASPPVPQRARSPAHSQAVAFDLTPELLVAELCYQFD